MNKKTRCNYDENIYFHYSCNGFNYLNFTLAVYLPLRKMRSIIILTEGNRDVRQENTLSLPNWLTEVRWEMF